MIRFDTRPYRSSHGTEPRGRGSWAFTFTTGAPTGDVDVLSDDLFWANGTFSEARSAAKVEALRRFPRAANVWVEVQP